MLQLSPRDRSLPQCWKKWTICLAYSGFWLEIELQLVTAAADSILRLNRVPARLDTSYSCLESWRLDTSYDWFEFWRLDTSCDWLHPTTDSSSSDWMRVTADSVPWPTWVTAAGYELQLIPFYADLSSSIWIWLKTDSILQLTMSCGWIRVTADYILGWLEFQRRDTT